MLIDVHPSKFRKNLYLMGSEQDRLNEMRRPPLALVVLAFLLLASFSSCYAEAGERLGSQLVIKVVRLDYAEAEDLASVLAPFLSPAGRIVAYAPLNCLIIKDKAHIVKRLVEIIKGPSEKDL